MTSTVKPFLPYGRQQITQSDIDAVTAVLRGNWLTTGPFVEQFERALADRLSATHVIACSNGSTALQLAVLAAGVGPGQVAIVPAVTFMATASAILHAGAEIEFADVNPDTALMEAAHLEAAVASARDRFPDHRVTCALPVHMGGRAAPMAELSAVARTREIDLIEDAAHAIGSVSPDGQVGACRFSSATTFSFHPVKTLTTGEGGAITTEDDQLALRMRRLRTQGIIREPDQFTDRNAGFTDGVANPWYYEIEEPGFNFRLTDIQCALGISQLHRLDEAIAHRRALHDAYVSRIGEIDGLSLPPDAPGHVSAWHLAMALVDFEAFGASRADVMRSLSADGIGTQVHYIPLYRHPLFVRRYGEHHLPGAEAYYARTLSLPLHLQMTGDDVERVLSLLREHLGR